MRKMIGFIRIILIILSYVLLIFSVYAWVSGYRISGSEWLPIMASSSLNLLIFFVYGALGLGHMKSIDRQRISVGTILSKAGFLGNIIMFIVSVLIVVGFGIIP